MFTVKDGLKVGSVQVVNAAGEVLTRAASAIKLSDACTLTITGDAGGSVATDFSANASLTLALANVAANTGLFGNATSIPQITIDAKGRVTTASAIPVAPPWSQVTGKPSSLAGYGITDAQPLDSTLSGLANATTSANTLIYASGSDLFATTPFTPFARTLLSGANAVEMRATLGVGGDSSISPLLVSYGAANWTSGVQVPTITAANTVVLRNVGTAPTNILDRQSADTLYQNATNLTTGTVSDVRLSTNVPLKTSNATISAWYTMTKPVVSTNDLNADGSNFSVNTTTKSASLMAYDVRRNGNSVGGITLNGVGVFSNVTVSGIPVWHAGNDGAGSGLDADLLDGRQSDYYADATNLTAGVLHVDRLPSEAARKSANNAFSVEQSIFAGNSTTARSFLRLIPTNAAVGSPELRVRKGAASDAWSIELWDGATSNGTLNLVANVVQINGSLVWTANNDGAGTGLDADLLDGQQGTFYQNATNLASGTISDARLPVALSAKTFLGDIDVNAHDVTNVNQLILANPGPGKGIGWNGGNLWKIYESPDNLTTDSAGNLQFVQNATRRMTLMTNGALMVGSGLVWTAANDGPSSGLDADLLDGEHGSFFQNATNLNAGTLALARTPAYSGDATKAAGSGTLTLATVNSNVGAYGNATHIPQVTVDAKGRVTAITTIVAAGGGGSSSWSSITDKPSTLSGYGITDAVSLTSDQTVNGNKTFTGNVVVGGDLAVLGQTFVINSVNLEVADSIINLAKNNPGGAFAYSGLRVERGTAGNDAFAVFGEASDIWRFGTATDDSGTGWVSLPVSGSRFISDAATGTAPLTVTSTTLVSNLNADLLDGQHGTYYQNATNITAGTLAVARSPAYSGDVSKPAGSATVTLVSVNPNVGSFGNATHIPQVTVDAKGRVTAITTIQTSGGSGGGSSYFKDPVVVATTGNINLSSPGTSIDGVTMVSGDRVLVWMQTTASQNGIYVFNGATSVMTRASDADTWLELPASLIVVQKGTEFGDDVFVCSSDLGGTLGTTAVTFINKTQPTGGFDSDPWDPLLAQGFGPVYATGTGSSQNITLPQPGHVTESVFVTVNGVLQDPVTYSIVGTTLTLTASNGAAIIVRCGGYKGDPGAAGTMSSPGNILFPIDNVYTIGLANSTARPSYVYVGTEIKSPNIQVASSANSAMLYQPSAGALAISTNRGSVGNEKAYNFGADGNFSTANGSIISNSALISNGGSISSKAEVYPYLQLHNTGAGSNAKYWRLGLATTGQFKLGLMNDAYDTETTALSVSRSGTTVGDWIFNGVSFSFGGPITLVGKATLAASSTSGASLTAPHGSAPSSPINGDIWTTTDGLFVRANGVTYGMERQGEAWGVNTQTASYVAALSDKGKIIEMSNASANTLTIPPASSVAFPINTRIDVVQYGAGQTTIAAGAGVTIRSAGGKLKLTSQYSSASLYKRGTDEWVLMGDLIL